EFLMAADGSFRLIRRAETINDYFATLDFEGSDFSQFARKKTLSAIPPEQ
ncbi:MAG: diaminopimelate decarboxylase, partial [Methanomicrobiales archaeon]|nr:diaminopimelate decarboxylase [Methanomicrobiales archaeon]